MTTSDTTSGAPACAMCTRIAGIGGEALYADESWVLLPATERPGWAMLASRQHRAWTWDLTAAEQATLGPALTKATTAIRDEFDLDKVYVFGFGEAMPHFHLLLTPRIQPMGVAMRTALTEFGGALEDAEAAGKARTSIRARLSS